MARLRLILGDQLNDGCVGEHPIIMIESLRLAAARPNHKHKLILFFSAMRHFAQRQRELGIEVHYFAESEGFKPALERLFDQFPRATIEIVDPNDRPFAHVFNRWVTELGGKLEVVQNPLWITTADEFDDWSKERKSLRLENFYRKVRTSTGILMDGKEPLGGEWNYDHDNRKKPPKGYAPPVAPTYSQDEITQSVSEFISRTFPNHMGDATEFDWPVTREEAKRELNDFIEKRLPDFGIYEDAMLSDEPLLNHSRLSPLMNLGLLHPREVVEAAVSAYTSRTDVPINSVEGFVRQILGWREFIFHIYRTTPGLSEENELEHRNRLPAFFWDGDTKMNCVSNSVNGVIRTGYNHHIQRLMVLGNLMMLCRVDPKEVLNWFTACYVDALDWVMVPNVMGMSQFADGGAFTTKPYAAGSNYINKMSNYCSGCEFDRKTTTGENACPYNSLYWNFIHTHQDRFAKNARMNMILANWRKRDEEVKEEIVTHAEKLIASFCAN